MPRFSKTRKALMTTMMKEAIFEATATVMREHGVAGTTMNRVAEAAALSKSNLYDYFESKHELLAFVSERIVGPFLKMLEGLVAAPSPAPQKLEDILRYALDDSTKHKSIIRLLAQSGENQQVKQHSRPKILEALTAIFAQGIQAGAFLPHNPAHTGRMFLGCLAELFEMQTCNVSSEMVSEYVEVLISAVRHGFSIHATTGLGADVASRPAPQD
jgi:AcrR family transcriptional regulator